MILDTSYLIDLKDGDPSAHAKSRELHKRDVHQKITLVTVHELYYGVEISESKKEERKVENLLQMFPVTSIGEETMEKSAELVATADKQSSGDECDVGPFDPLIGAVAILEGEAVLTNNVDDFDTLGVSYESY